MGLGESVVFQVSLRISVGTDIGTYKHGLRFISISAMLF